MESYMEALAVPPEGLMYTSEVDEDMIMSQLLANYCSVTNELNHQVSSSQIPFANFPSSHECSTATNMEGIANLYSHRVMATNHHNPEAFCLWDANSASATNLFLSQSGENGGMDRVLSNANAEDHEVMSENSKKRSCTTSVDHVQKNKRNVKSKKEVLTRNIQDSCSSGDDESMIADSHQDLSPKGAATLNLNCKTRASKGLATDPQSTYARKRREKINARLRILQNLVPNGTKVDISTMLEDAVEYVKFLQLQIKLLSSDEMWMYAPVVNNGIGLGTDDLLNS